MAQTAIIFTANRVIRGLTTDASPVLATDQSAVVLATPIDLGGGSPGWKLDTSTPPNKVACSLAEWQAAGMDDAFNRAARLTKLNDLIAILQSMSTDATLPAKVQTFATRMLAFLT